MSISSSLITQPLEQPTGTLPSYYLSKTDTGGDRCIITYIETPGKTDRMKSKGRKVWASLETLAEKTTAELDKKRKDQERIDIQVAVSTRRTVESVNRWYEKQNAHASLKREEELLSRWPWCSALQECEETLKVPEQEMATAVNSAREAMENLESLCPGESRARVMWWLVENGAEEKTVGTLLRNLDYVEFVRELFSDTEVNVEGVDPMEEVDGNGEDDEEDADSTKDAESDEDGKKRVLVEVDGVMGSWEWAKSVDGHWDVWEFRASH